MFDRRKETHVNVRKQSELIHPSTEAYLELDVWIPSLDICFEFQDSHHYVTTWYYQNAQETISQKDNISLSIHHTLPYHSFHSFTQHNDEESNDPTKRDNIFCSSLLVEWNARKPNCYNPLPKTRLNTLCGLLASSIPDVGELMLASFPVEPGGILSTSHHAWWIGEKYDGIRFCWNPHESKVYLKQLFPHEASSRFRFHYLPLLTLHPLIYFGSIITLHRYTRSNRELDLLPTFGASVPMAFIDGEFWFGRGQYSLTYPLIKGMTNVLPWHALRMMSFDSPSQEHHCLSFEERFGLLLTNVPSSHPFTIVALRVLCESETHAKSVLYNIVEDGGEGTILRKCRSVYEHGRSSSLVKLKTTLGDREGIVIGCHLGSLRLRLPEGGTFTVPSSDVHIPTPSVGDIVSFSFESNMRIGATPVHPTVFRVRDDLDWEHVVRDAITNRKQPVEDYKETVTQASYWNFSHRMRVFLENLAKSKHMDPLVPDTWYNISVDSICLYKKGRAIMRKFGAYSDALQHLFPDIKFNLSEFPRYWRSMENRRKFFENYARQNGFDPQDPNSWHSLRRKSIVSVKGARNAIFYHNNSVPQALLDLFPDIGLSRKKFSDFRLFAHSWNRRKFFENYAHENAFNPLVPNNWYSQPREKILSLKGASEVLSYHQHKLSQALADLFPDFGIDVSKLRVQSKWHQRENRRKFFEDYAASHGFHPSSAKSWMLQPRDSIMSTKGAYRVVSFHQDNVHKALVDLFPDIGLDKSRYFARLAWRGAERRRAFFVNYAKQCQFDPYRPDLWYSHSKSITSLKDAASVLSYHNNSLSQALSDLFPNQGFDMSSFPAKSSWMNVNKRKQFFCDYAQVHGFDPHMADNWYSQPIKKIVSYKGSFGVISYYNHSVPKALMELFPNIGLDKSNFMSI